MRKDMREMDGLTSGERVLLFAILGLFAAAGLVQLGKRTATLADTPPPEIQGEAVGQVAESK